MMDHPLPEDEAIKTVHPLRSNRHDLYQEAQRLVGAKHSKQALVELVNWLLHRVEKAKQPHSGLPDVDPADEALVDRLVARKVATSRITRITRTASPPIQFDDDPVGVARDAVIEAAKLWGGFSAALRLSDDDAELRLADCLDALIAAEAEENK